MKKIINVIILIVFVCFFVLTNISTKCISTATAATTDYYANVDTSTGQKLMSSLHTIISTGTKDVGYSGLWEAYKTTDVKSGTNIIWDMYSNEEYVAGGSKQGVSYKVEGDSYNREHVVPQSWFGKASPMVSDLFHVYPTDGYVNNRRSNYLYGEVGSASYTSKNGSKLGTSSFSGYSGTVFEPIDEYKGDFARTYFYMACRYSDGISSWTSDAKYNFSDSYPYLTTYSINLFLKWNALDPVSEKETTRNDAVYSIQNNRNPFIDHPEYINIIWGGSSSTTTYNVTYNANGGTFGTSETKTYTGVTTLTIPSNPTKTGYTFVGWNTSSSATTALTLTLGSTVSANTTYYAVWKESSTPLSDYESILNSFKTITLQSQLVFNYLINTSSSGGSSSQSATYNSFISWTGSNLKLETEYDFTNSCNYDTELFNIKYNTNGKANLYSNDSQVRLYNASGNGTSITIEGKTGVIITDVTYTTSSGTLTKNVDSANNKITLKNTSSSSTKYIALTSLTISYTTGTQTTTYTVNSASIRMKYALDSNLKTKLEEYAASEEKTLKFGICLDNGTFYECSIINNEVILVLSGIDSNHFKSNIGCYAAFKLGDDVVKATTIKSESVKSIATNYVDKLSSDATVQAHLGVLTYLKNL